MIFEKISVDGRILYMLGVEHTKNLEKLSIIKKIILDINPEIILLEGNFNEATFQSEEIAMSFGEMAFASYISKKNKIKVLSNDPPIESQKEFVSNRFSNDASKLYFLLRNNQINKNSFNELNSLMKKILNEDYNPKKDYFNYFNPKKDFNAFNKVTRELNSFRDDFMINQIKKIIQNNKKILVIKGEYHISSELSKIKEELNGKRI